MWADAQVSGAASSLDARAWYGSYALNLYSNFTFYAVDPVNGDQIEQEDRRTFGGFDASWRKIDRAGAWTFVTQVGTQGRQDTIHSWLYRTKDREILSTTVDANVVEDRIGAYVREEIDLGKWARLSGGARVDHYTFAVDDNLDVPGDGVVNEGVADAALVSPKANLVVTAIPHADVFVNWGYGFHSNDARGVVEGADPVTPLTRGMGYEAGLRLHQAGLGQVALAAWALDMDAETVWVGDEGTTELNGPTHRQGLDASVRANPLSWLQADLDVCVAKATYVDNAGNGGAVALAPTFTLSGGIGIDHPSGVSAGARVRSIGARPATEDGSLTAEGWTILDAEAAYRWRFLKLGVQVDNVLGTEWKEVQFANDSQLPGEAAPVTDIHFTPGWPRTLMATLTVFR